VRTHGAESDAQFYKKNNLTQIKETFIAERGHSNGGASQVMQKI
jgi:hypothetical protein